MLGRHFDLDVYIGSGIRGAWEHFRRARRADVSFGWFGSVYTFFLVAGSRLGGGRSIVMLGGVDVAKDHANSYGIWRSRWKGMLLGYALRHADRVFAVDMSLRRTLERSSGRSWEKIEPLPTGYDPAGWTSHFPKEPMVLCVASTNSADRARIKGLDLFIEAARRLPGVPFHAVGIDPPVIALLGASAPPNLHLHPPVPRERLLGYYHRAKVYCQPSRSEGLPNALCEAMLCGCIPVGSDVGGIPGAIGDAGIVVPPDDPVALRDAIARALEEPEALGASARRRIETNFPRERRERTLVAIIKGLMRAEAIG